MARNRSSAFGGVQIATQAGPGLIIGASRGLVRLEPGISGQLSINVLIYIPVFVQSEAQSAYAAKVVDRQASLNPSIRAEGAAELHGDLAMVLNLACGPTQPSPSACAPELDDATHRCPLCPGNGGRGPAGNL
jgi:hypothetical protein